MFAHWEAGNTIAYPKPAQSSRSQIEGEWEIRVYRLGLRSVVALHGAVREETREPAGFGLVGIDRESGIVAATGVSHMVSASAKAALVPGVVEVEHERRVNAYGWMKAFGRLPGAVADAG